ncbi:PadR family transcriptional regulator [Agrococcus sp. Ld7]|uniref:PadR family transcriptional regulator n=1 Tax=Agrococcus sp. Ld7 TaxID=649148 RepID=UPI0038640244
MTPVFGHGALRLYLLSLLAEAPRHGYELMQALEHRFGGTYSPSAGTIYPRLAKLEEDGLVTKTVEGRKSTYTITDAGRAELRAREGELLSLETEITDSVRRMASDVRASVRSAMQGLRADLAEAERDARSAARRPPSTTEARADGSPAGQRAAARIAIHDVDLALSDFRQRVREAARRRGGEHMTGERAATVRRELDAALLRIESVLGG